jgi:hypothetical protein
MAAGKRVVEIEREDGGPEAILGRSDPRVDIPGARASRRSHDSTIVSSTSARAT